METGPVLRRQRGDGREGRRGSIKSRIVEMSKESETIIIHLSDLLTSAVSINSLTLISRSPNRPHPPFQLLGNYARKAPYTF